MDRDAALDVVIVLPSLAQGGAERVMVNHAIGFREAGDRVRVVMTDGTADNGGALRASLPSDIAVTTLGQPRVRAALPALVRLLRRDVPDVVVVTHTHLNLALCAIRPLLPRGTGLVLREPTHAPVLLDGRSTRARRIAQRMLYRRADSVIATSGVMEQDLRQLTRASVVMLPNPVRVAEIRSIASRSSPSPMAAVGRTYVSVGRLDTQKSLPELLRAFAEGSEPLDQLVLIGDGPAREQVSTAVVELGLEDRVRMTGFLAEPWGEVAQADAFLLASRAEGMPNAVLEALAVGTSVIAASELEALTDVRDAAPRGALTLVDRNRFAGAIAAFRTEDNRASAFPRPSLLPAAYDADGATAELRRLLRDVRDHNERADA